MEVTSNRPKRCPQLVACRPFGAENMRLGTAEEQEPQPGGPPSARGIARPGSCRGPTRWLFRFLLLLALVTRAHAQAPAPTQVPITFQYFYDDLGQLTKVVDSTGTVIEYVYDEVGNILEEENWGRSARLAEFRDRKIRTPPNPMYRYQ